MKRRNPYRIYENPEASPRALAAQRVMLDQSLSASERIARAKRILAGQEEIDAPLPPQIRVPLPAQAPISRAAMAQRIMLDESRPKSERLALAKRILAGEDLPSEQLEVAPIGLTATPLSEQAFNLTREQKRALRAEEQAQRRMEEGEADVLREQYERDRIRSFMEGLAASGSKAAETIIAVDPEPVAAGELSFTDFVAIKIQREIEDEAEGFSVAKQLGLEPPSEERKIAFFDKVEKIQKALDILGFGSLPAIRKLQAKVYKLLLRNAIIASRRLLKGRKDISSQEVAAEVAAHCYRNIHTFRAQSKLMTWVWAATRNLIIDLLQRNRVKGISGLGGQGLGFTQTTTVNEEVINKLASKGSLTDKQVNFLKTRAIVRADDEKVLESVASEDNSEEEQARAEEVVLGIEEDRIITEAFSKLADKYKAILEAYAYRGKIKLADGTEVETGDEPPSRLMIANILGIPYMQVGKKLYQARQELISLFEKPVVPPYFGVLAERYLPEVKKASITKDGVQIETPTVGLIRGRPEWAKRPIAEEYFAAEAALEPEVYDVEALSKERAEILNKKIKHRATRADMDRLQDIQDQLEQIKRVEQQARLKEEQSRALAGRETPEARLRYGGAGSEAIGFYQRDPTRARRVNPNEDIIYFTGAVDLLDMLESGAINPEQYELLLYQVEAELQD